MKNLFNCAVALSIAMLLGITTMAQDERTKAEFYGGYSFHSAQTDLEDDDFADFNDRLNSHGVELAITGNFHRYAGVKFDFSTHSKSEGFVDGLDNFDFKLRTNQFLGGIQFKDNKKDGQRIKPFAHILGGLANQKITASGTFVDGGITTTFNESDSVNNFAMVLGGGIDIKVNRRVDIRLIQFDYNPVFFRDADFDDFELPGRTQNNYRIGVGIVFH